jgi:hypothetical protein
VRPPIAALLAGRVIWGIPMVGTCSIITHGNNFTISQWKKVLGNREPKNREFIEDMSNELRGGLGKLM